MEGWEDIRMKQVKEDLVLWLLLNVFLPAISSKLLKTVARWNRLILHKLWNTLSMWVILPLNLTFWYINTTCDIFFKISRNSKDSSDIRFLIPEIKFYSYFMLSILYETSRKCICMAENGISSKTGYVWLKDKSPSDVTVCKKKEDNI